MKLPVFITFLVGFFISTGIYCQKTKSEFTAVVESETGDTNLTIVYGNLGEINCLFKLGNVHISYGEKKYWFHNKATYPFISDTLGNYIIEIKTYEENLGLSFNYKDSNSPTNFYVPVPREWKGKRIKVDVGLKLMFVGLDCF